MRIGSLSIVWMLAAASQIPAAVVLVQDGAAESAIFVPARVLGENIPGLTKTSEIEAENQRQRLRESVRDLAHYLEKISGGKVEVVAGPPPATEKRVPILVGELAETVFGPVGKSAPFKQGFRVVAGPKGVGLYGESDLSSSYAIYELLDNLGCRWFMPSELGEVIPSQKTITLVAGDRQLAPYTLQRGIWYADENYKRRNRYGGLLLHSGHALEMYLTKEDRAKMPEVKATIAGKPHEHRLKWSSQKLADFLAEKIIAEQTRDPKPSWSLSPDDGADFCESKEDRDLDAGDFDTTNGTMSLTDRLMVLCNRIATKVSAKHPDLPFGMLAYAQYIRAPKREKLHPNIVPVIAPIAFNRYHPMSDDKVPGNKEVRDLVTGWGKMAKMTGVYYYAFNLAETSAPCPLLTKWAADLPVLYANGCKFWIPETLPNFEVLMHALWMGNRMAWDPTQKPTEIYDEINAKFYGAAGSAMAAYWKFVDEVWVQTPEYSGCGFGYLRRWTPERLTKARQLLDAALAACKTPIEKQRVQIADESLRQFELFMKLRRDQADGKFDSLAAGAAEWMKQAAALGEKYKDQFCFCKVPWTPYTVGGTYFNSFYKLTYDDASRIAREFDILTPKPLRAFRYRADADKKGEALGWTRPDFDDQAWKTTDVCVETWSTIGYHDWFKSMGYRAEVDLPAVPNGKKVFLWIGATDGSAKVFVNGKHIPYVDAKAKSADEFNGYCQPASFDVTAAVRPGKNQVTILCTRTFFNELGTGGLLAPVTFYREK